MTKARTNGQKKRARGRPPVEDVDREPSGRISRINHTSERKMNALAPAIEARARALGIPLDMPKRMQGESLAEYQARIGAREAMVRALAPLAQRGWLGDPVGQVIDDQHDVAELWATVQTIRARRTAYLRAIAAPEPNAKSANLMVAPTEGETGVEVRMMPSKPLTEEEAAEEATDRWTELTVVLLALDPLAVRFTIDRICAEIPGSDNAPVPKEPVLRVLRYVRAKMMAAT